MRGLLAAGHDRPQGHRREFCGVPASTLILAALVAPTLWAGPLKPACELLTSAEAAKVLGAAVTIKQDESGPDDRGGDNCVWTTADRRNVMVRVVAVAKQDMVPLKFKQEVEEAFSGARPPEVLAALGDEAKYRTYDGNLDGGVIVGRKEKVVFTVEGRTSRKNLIDLTGALLSRL